VCFICGKPGHHSYECPEAAAGDGDEEAAEETGERPTRQATATQMVLSGSNFCKDHEVILDNASDVTIMHPRFLTNVRECRTEDFFSGLSGPKKRITKVGDLAGFFECACDDDVRASIISQGQVEDLYDITWIQGDRYIVHLDGQDLEFVRKGKVYVANMRAWIEGDQRALSPQSKQGSGASKKGALKGQQAQEFIRAAGYPTEREAINLLQDGNLVNAPVSAQGVWESVRLLGQAPEAIRGRAVKSPVERQEVDETSREQRKHQVLFLDVMEVCKQHFLITLAEPLQLMMNACTGRQTTENLGRALQGQLDLLRARGFVPVRVHVDPQSGLRALVGQFPGVEVDVCGAGDHMDKVDVRIRRLKETIRSVVSGLPWKLPKVLVKDLVAYAVSRRNVRRTTSRVDSVAPRVAFTGRRIQYKKEFAIAFGDYVESYDPHGIKNDAMRERTQPGIALYPAGNAHGSWIFYQVNTGKRVMPSTWTKMVTSQLIVDKMNELAGQVDVQLFPADQAPEVSAEASDTAHVETIIVDPEVETDTLLAPAEGAEDAEMANTGVQVADEAMEPEANTASNVDPYEEDLPIIGEVVALRTSVSKALKEYGSTALESIKKEVIQLFEVKRALVPIRRRDLTSKQRRAIIRSHMFLTGKYDAVGLFEKLKARLVGDGRGQDRTLYPDVWSPTATTQGLFVVLSVAAKEKRLAGKADVGSAYLEANMKGEMVTMEIDPILARLIIIILPQLEQYQEPSGKILVRLDKALYGCIESTKLWYEKLTSELALQGFVPNEVEPCVMNRDLQGVQCTLVLYVDDILILSAKRRKLITVHVIALCLSLPLLSRTTSRITYVSRNTKM
jgi:Reverse transcriptase (RNA-dependent DNA polymerase)